MEFAHCIRDHLFTGEVVNECQAWRHPAVPSASKLTASSPLMALLNTLQTNNCCFESVLLSHPLFFLCNLLLLLLPVRVIVRQMEKLQLKAFAISP